MSQYQRTKAILNVERFRYLVFLGILICCALFLAGRLAYGYLSDPDYFPVRTIKIAATYEHLTHEELEHVLEKHTGQSFFSLSTTGLREDLLSLPWVNSADVYRIWPDTLKIKLIEKKPIAFWGKNLLTAEGNLFNAGLISSDKPMPRLWGPESQQTEVLQVYEKLSKILSMYQLNASGLQLRANQSWVLLIDGDVKIYLGKKELEERLLRFCKSYPAVFAQKAEQLVSVDLRYPSGMAVQWKQQTER